MPRRKSPLDLTRSDLPPSKAPTLVPTPTNIAEFIRFLTATNRR